MGRLIDADKLIISAENTFARPNGFIQLIEEQPTAYDKEKVVEELEEYRANFDCRICKYNKTEGQVCLKDCTDALIDGLFDIVKRGGVDD
jgi:hypothetical protein